MQDATPEVFGIPRFRKRFRGYDRKQVDAFLEEVTEELERLNAQHKKLVGLVKDKSVKLAEAFEHNRKLSRSLSEMGESAKRAEERVQEHANLIISKAELTAEKILGSAHQRVAQLHEDLTELKRQRTHFEVKLRSVIEAHLKLLEMEEESYREADELEGKIRFLNKP